MGFDLLPAMVTLLARLTGIVAADNGDLCMCHDIMGAIWESKVQRSKAVGSI